MSTSPNQLDAARRNAQRRKAEGEAARDRTQRKRANQRKQLDTKKAYTGCETCRLTTEDLAVEQATLRAQFYGRRYPNTAAAQCRAYQEGKHG